MGRWVRHPLPPQCSTSVAVTPALVTYDPTAVQLVASGHDTDSRLALPPDPGLTVVWTVQALPFQCSASTRPGPELLAYWPTAVQLVAVRQDTLVSAFQVEPGLALGRADQVRPVRCSASVTVVLALFPDCPTATQLGPETHEMPFHVTSFRPAATGVASTRHAVPFQCSAPALPTAVQLVAEGQETASRPAWAEFFGRGVAWIVQVLPSQCSASGYWALPEGLPYSPTAVQLVAEAHETPSR